MPRPIMVHSGTSSRIPIAVPIRTRTISAPSGLQLLQVRYQEQMLLEKEKKMLQFHQQQQERILHRVRQRYHQRTGPVREFFEERRNLRKQNAFLASPVNKLTHDKLGIDNVNAGDQKTDQCVLSKPTLHGRSRTIGRDRSNLLAPLSDPRYPAPPSTKKSKIARAYVPGNAVDSPDSKQNVVDSKPVQKEESGDEGYNSAQSAKKAAKTPNGYGAWMEKQAKARELKEKKQALVKQHEPPLESTNEVENESSNVNGFRKWQLEQLKAREERLKQYNEKHPQADGEQSEQAKNKAIKAREIELQNLIRQKEQELVEMAQRRQLQKQNSPPDRKTPVSREAKDKSRPNSGKHLATHSPQDRKQRSPQSPPHPNTKTLHPTHLSPSNTRIVSPYAPPSDQKPPLPKSLRPPPKIQRRKVDPDEPVSVNENTSFYIQKAAEAEAAAVPMDLVECATCGRKFAAERLSKHAKACNGIKKNRRVFDPVKMRTDGTEMQKYVQYEQKANKTSTLQQKQQKSSWRAKHQDFIRTIRYAKQVSAIEAQGGNLADLPPPPPSDTSDFTQCPHCQRRFNPRAAERHIPKCKDIKSRPPPFRRGI